MYSLYPDDDLRAARTRFSGYAISQLHDDTGAAFYTAVLIARDPDPRLAPLLSARSLNALVDKLHHQYAHALAAHIPRPRTGPPSDDALTEKLCSALRDMRDRGLLPRWKPGPDKS